MPRSRVAGLFGVALAVALGLAGWVAFGAATGSTAIGAKITRLADTRVVVEDEADLIAAHRGERLRRGRAHQALDRRRHDVVRASWELHRDQPVLIGNARANLLPGRVEHEYFDVGDRPRGARRIGRVLLDRADGPGDEAQIQCDVVASRHRAFERDVIALLAHEGHGAVAVHVVAPFVALDAAGHTVACAHSDCDGEAGPVLAGLEPARLADHVGAGWLHAGETLIGCENERGSLG